MICRVLQIRLRHMRFTLPAAGQSSCVTCLTRIGEKTSHSHTTAVLYSKNAIFAYITQADGILSVAFCRLNNYFITFA